MDSKFRTSFIPKQEVSLSSGRGESNFRFSVFSIIAAVVFGISAVLAIWVFIYQKTLVGDINKMNAELVAARASFEPTFIEQLVTIDSRIESAKTLLNTHSVITPIFAILENETLQGVRFTGFNYSIDSKGQPSIQLTAETAGFPSVALQSDVFNAESKIKNPAFTGISADDKGLVRFNFQSGLDSSAFLYKNIFDTSNGGDAGDAVNGGNGVKITPAP